MVAVCLLITLAILSAYYSVLSSQRSTSVLYNLLTASVFTCAQIILTELFLGLFHQFYPSFVITVNLFLAVLVAVLGRRRRGVGSPPSLSDGFVRARVEAWSAFDRYSISLAVLAALVYTWILTAAYFLPPRGLDDLVYHLPPIFEYVKSHEIRLLPVDMMWPFAYPENAELLFLWPVLFTHSQQWLDGMNVPFVLLSVLTVYALFRHFAISEKDALFSALLYALCPVVLMIAGVNYVDIIVSLFLLLSLYFSVLFFEHQRVRDLYTAALATGLMCGMKYTALVLVPPLLALIMPGFRRGTRRHAFGALAAAAAAGGWWYVRNAVLLGDPVFPMHALSTLPRALQIQGGSILHNILYNAPYWITRYPLADTGVGKYDGGFGLVFWGLGFLSWLFVSVLWLFTFRRRTVPGFIVLAYLPVGFLLLLMNPPRWIHLNGRFSMFVVVIGLFAFCEVLRWLKDPRLVSLIKVLCIVLSVITVSLLSVSDRPSYRIGQAVSDTVNHAKRSPYRYLAGSLPQHAMLQPAWEALDLLTRDDPVGMNCASASTQDPDLYIPAPLYGSRLQNRVLNMDPQARVQADAYVLPYLDSGKLDAPVLFFDGAQFLRITIREMMARDDYVVVVQTDHVCLMLRRELFNRADKQRQLQSYYRTAWPDAAAAAQELAPKLDADTPLITSSEIGYALRSVDSGRSWADRVYPAFRDREQEVAVRLHMKQCYTLERPLPGYRSRKILQAVYGRKNIDVYLNSRA